MWTLSYSVLAKLMIKFSGDLTYSESLSLSPELAANMTSLSGSAVSLGVAVGASACRAWIDFFCCCQ